MDMMRQIILIFSILVFSPIVFHPLVLAETITLDKNDYVYGDVIIISGDVQYSEGYFVGLQIINPSNSDIVMIDQFFPGKDGSFSKSYKAQGPKWNEDGIYKIKIVFNEHTLTKTFNFKKYEFSEITETNKPESKRDTKSSSPTTLKPTFEIASTDPKLRVQGFPDPTKPPNYYFERYAKDKEYRNWFYKTFPEHSLSDIVEYAHTIIPGFPDNANPPWYYVDRYNTEEIYRDWFDSQFPAKSIYEVIGYPESLFLQIPNWVKNNARWWSSGLITDSDFLGGISFLIDEGILIIPTMPESETSSSQQVPLWVKSTARWWADGKIDENEFLKGIQFLVENGIIKI